MPFAGKDWIPNNVLMAALQGAGEGAMESAPIQGLSKFLGGVGHALGAPLRGVSAVGQNLSDTGKKIDVSDAMLYGHDMDTGQSPVPYGKLARTEIFGENDAGDDQQSWLGDKAGDLVEAVGNTISNPLELGLAVGAGGAASRAAGVAASEDALIMSAKSQQKALSNVGAAKIQPKPSFNPQTGDVRTPSTLLDMDLAAGGSVQNRVYSFPNQMKQARASTSPNKLKKIVPGQQRVASSLLKNKPADVWNEVQGDSSHRGGTVYRRELGRGGGAVPADDAAAQEMLLREGFLDDPMLGGSPLHDIPDPRLGAQSAFNTNMRPRLR